MKRTVPTAFYFFERKRYGRWFDDTPEGVVLWEPEAKRKADMQALYQRECEQNGTVYRAIYLQNVADDKSTMLDYLIWLNAAYNSWQQSGDFDTFMEYMQAQHYEPSA